MTDKPGGWTVDTLKEHFDRVISDQNATINRRFEDVESTADKAVVATRNETRIALDASKEAAAKAAAAQDSYNSTHNDLIRKADKVAESTMPAREIEARFTAEREHFDEVLNGFTEKIEQLRVGVEQLRVGEGHTRGGADALDRARQQRNWALGIVAMIFMSLLIYFLNRGG